MRPIKAACDLLGGPSRLARAAGVTPQFVSQWLKDERPVPPRRALLIEKATNGAVDRYALRPDIFDIVEATQ